MKALELLYTAIICSIILTGCGLPASEILINNTGWTYTTLRAIDPVDYPQATQDLIAAYVKHRKSQFLAPTHDHKSEVAIRFDFLDLAIRSNFDLYLAIDHFPGGSNQLPLHAATDVSWDTLIVFPAAGPIQIFDPTLTPRQMTSARILRDPTLGSVEIHLNPEMLEGIDMGFKLQAFVTAPGEKVPLDSTEAIPSDGPPPPPAQVLLTFWNTMPSYTPAQAMRRWDGAHTGPFGARHGLFNLLRAARDFKIPIVLLDLKNPFSLSATEYAGGLPLIQKMIQEDLLVLPEAGPLPQRQVNADIIDLMLNSSHETALGFGVDTSKFTYTHPSSSLVGRYNIIFTLNDERQSGSINEFGLAYMQAWRGAKIIQIPELDDQPQVNLGGPDLAVRRALVNSALTAREHTGSNSAPFIVLGGDLPQSPWGDPNSITAAFRYFKLHPWIEVLGAHDLQTMKASPSYTLQRTDQGEATLLNRNMITNLDEMPEIPLTRASKDYILSLNSPIYPQQNQLEKLRAHYSGQLGVLMYAVLWAENPRPVHDCSQDLDFDEVPECILASDNVLTIYEPRIGALTWAFIRSSAHTHQVIGPSSQLVVGQSNQNEWDMSLGLRADPDVIPGITATGSDSIERISLEEGRISFVTQNGSRSIQLNSSGFSVVYRSGSKIDLQIPLILDPWQRFTPGWGLDYHGERTTSGYLWQHSSGIKIHLQTTNPLTANTYADTHERMGRVENPNFDYPPGHYLPFPMALIEITGDRNVAFSIQLTYP